MDDIRVDVGVYTSLTVDLTNFDFDGIRKVVFTVKNNKTGNPILTREFEPPSASHQIVVTPMESKSMTDNAEYDFVVVADDGKTYKNGDNGKIVLRRGIGECPRPL